MAKVFLWKLGSFEHKVYPHQQTIETLQKMVSEWDGKSDFHIVWGPDLTLEVHDTDNPLSLIRAASLKPTVTITSHIANENQPSL